MSGDRRHVVGTALFEVAVAPGGAGAAVTEGLPSYLHDRLLPLAESIFDEFSVPGRVLRIDRLDLDLGPVLAERPPEEAAAHFERALRSALSDHVQSAGMVGGDATLLGLPGSDGAEGLGGPAAEVSGAEAERDVLLHFLRTGTLPWSAGTGGDDSLDPLARRVVAGGREALTALLGGPMPDPLVVERFVRQMSDDTLVGAVERLAEGSPIPWARLLEGAPERARRTGLSGGALEKLRAALGRTLLEGLLRADGGGEGLERRLRGAAARLGGAGEAAVLKTLAALGTERDGGDGSHRVRRGRPEPEARLEAASGRASPSDTSGGTEATSAGDAEAGAGWEDGPRRLMDALRSGDPEGLDASEVEGLAGVEGLAARVRQALGVRAVRRRVVRGFPRPLLLALVGVMEPRVLARGRRSGSGAKATARERDDAAFWNDLFRDLASAGPEAVGEERLVAILAGDRRTEGAREGGIREGPADPGDGGRDAYAGLASLEEAFRTGDYGPVLAGLREWLEAYPTLVADRIRRHARSARVRREMARALPDTALMEVVRTLDPTMPARVVAVLDAAPGSAPPASVDVRERRRLLWALTLAHLVLDGEEDADGPAYETALAARLAAMGRGRTGASVPASRPEGIEAMARGFELRDRVAEALLGPVGSGEPFPDRTPEMEALAQDHPRQSLWLLGALQALESPGRMRILASRPASELRALSGGLLALLAGEDSEGAAALRQALARGESSASDPGAYQATLVDRILRGAALDPEGLLASAAEAPARPAPTTLHASGLGEAPGAPQVRGEGEPSSAAAPDTLRGESPDYAGRDARTARALHRLAAGSVPDAGALVDAVEDALERDPTGLRSVMERALEDGPGAARVVDSLPGAVLARVLGLLRPGAAARLLAASDLVVAAVLPGWAGVGGVPGLEAARWRFVARWLVEEGRLPDVALFSGGLLAFLVERGGPSATVEARAAAARARLASGPRPDRELARAVVEGTAAPESPRSETDPTRREPEAWMMEEQMFVSNAGMVLAAPFFPRLFTTLGLTEGRAFRSPEAAERAVHLLQHLVEGRTDRPEHLLALNKVLCGLGLEQPLPRSIEVTAREEEEIQGLLAALIQHWGALGNTSVEGLRESFFLRRGTLGVVDDAWRLEVEERAFDMLLDRVPWGFHMLRFPWMDRLLHVDWR